MMWVKFLKPFSYKPNLNVTMDYPAGIHANVPKACAEAAIQAEAAIEEEPEDKARSAAVKARQKPAET